MVVFILIKHLAVLVDWLAQNTTSPQWRKLATSSPLELNVNNDTYVNKADIAALVDFLAQNTTSPQWRMICNP